MPVHLQFELEIIPPRNKRTGSLNISGLRNRPGIDEIEPGGKKYPAIAKEKGKVLEWHEQGDKLLLKLDILEAEADQVKEFKAKKLTDKQATDMKRDFFKVPEKVVVESGVT